MRDILEIDQVSAEGIKMRLLSWLGTFECFAFYDSASQAVALSAGNYDWIAAAGSRHELTADENSLDRLKEFSETHKDWLFGGFCYELKDQLEDLRSDKALHVSFPKLFFFIPEHLIYAKDGIVWIESYSQASRILEQIMSTPEPARVLTEENAALESSIGRKNYLETIEVIREHIRLGDVYEMNFCVAYTASGVSPDPLQLFNELSRVSPAPFSALFRWKNKYLVSASPERFMMKKGRKLLSQPIKGTARRGNGPEEDKRNGEALRNSEKEQAENVMIVDLVRNDLSRSCRAGTVKVDELFGIYSYPAVHQMISTVSGELCENRGGIDGIASAFPMGSMTGAPKIMSMKLIEKYEPTARGLYSGSIGYFTPGGDFDFNVVIRSIVLDRESRKLSFHVGSAITYDSDPGQEYDECMLKAGALKSVLSRFGIRES